ncbi:glycosyltransferase, partial [Pararhodobacter sp. CCB-MM2]|uniref:glycosyltransferase n=1 Tax=Pararhodobacter sp. CCB-MM2 TaxID=1786003 RepID=UPI0011122534
QALSDIVMICSIGTEAQTRLVSQAFLMRNNVVATNVGGLPEMIEHNRTGLICPAADPSALANACIELINSEKLREEIKDNAEHYAYKEMTFERMMEGMLQAYHNALSHLPVNR